TIEVSMGRFVFIVGCACGLLATGGCMQLSHENLERVLCGPATHGAIPLRAKLLEPVAGDGEINLLAGQQVKDSEPKPPTKTLESLLQVPAEVPGAQVENIMLPSRKEREKLEAAIKAYFPDLPLLGADPQAGPGP